MPMYRVDVRRPGGEWTFGSLCLNSAEAMRHMAFARETYPKFSVRARPHAVAPPLPIFIDDTTVELTS